MRVGDWCCEHLTARLGRGEGWGGASAINAASPEAPRAAEMSPGKLQPHAYIDVLMTVSLPAMVDRPATTIAYIDGFNFYYGAVKGTPHKWLDLEALCRHLLPRDNIVKIRYFTARVNPRPEDPQQANRQETYLRALATLPHVEIHYGHFVTRSVKLPLAHPPAHGPRTVEVLRTEEKGSDVNLASYLLLDAFKGRCSTAVVISNDSDLARAIQLAQSELGVKVGIINPHSRSRQSRELLGLECSFYKHVPRQLLAQTQLPSLVHGPTGPIHKPKGW